jgi:PhnB protein
MAADHVPDGYHSITPYLSVRGADRLLDFVKKAFGATELDAPTVHEGVVRHAAVRIGDSVVEVSEANDRWGPMPAALHLYVPDCDAAYRRAVEAGAESLHEPMDMEYGERGAALRDPVGNNWYIATYTGRHQP